MGLYPFVQYGLVQYGLYPYGRYDLTIGGNYELSDVPRMRIRIRTADGGIGLWVETQKLEQMIPGKFPLMRIKTDNGDWLYTQMVPITPSSKVRVRTLKNGIAGPWVLYEEAGLNKEG